MKKLAAGLLTFALMVMLLPAGVVVSFAASGKLSFSDPTASVGDQISVTMKIAADAALGSSDVMLQYDADALEFVSGTNSTGGAGSISLGSGTTIVKIQVKAENGDVRTYQVSIAKGNGNGSTTVVSPSTGSSTGSSSSGFTTTGSTVGPGGSTGISNSGSSFGTTGPGSTNSGSQSSYPEGASGSGKLVTSSTGTSGSYPEGATGSGKLVTGN